MCYRTISHKMRCDVRPLISDGKVSMVDGYALPRSCGCATSANIKRWLRCEHHGCCRVATKIHLCADPDWCAGEVVFHSYTQAKFEVRDWTRDNVWPDAAWPERPAVDGQRFPRSGQAPGTRLRCEAPLFREALATLLEVGRTLAAVEHTVDRWAADLERLLLALKGPGGGGMPALSPATRNLLGAVVLLEEALDRGVEEQDRLARRFGRAHEELRKLERWGERAVTGLRRERDEDVGEDLDSPSYTRGTRVAYGVIGSSASRTRRYSVSVSS